MNGNPGLSSNLTSGGRDAKFSPKTKFGPMKNRIFPKLPAVLVGVALLSSGLMSAVSADSAPTLPYGASEVLKLVNAKVGDDTIVAYISHAPTGYTLSASDLVYLRSQGVSDGVLSAMLTHARPAESTTAAPAPVQVAAAPAPAAVVVQAPPTTTYVQSAPVVVAAPPTVVYDYGYYPYYYGPRYYGPGLSLSFGFGGRGYYGGGYRGGFHGGGGFHGHR